MLGVDGRSAVGTAAAEALPAIEKVKPATPSTGMAFFTCFVFAACFTRGIVSSSIPCQKNVRVQPRNSTLCQGTTQGWSDPLLRTQDHNNMFAGAMLRHRQGDGGSIDAFRSTRDCC